MKKPIKKVTPVRLDQNTIEAIKALGCDVSTFVREATLKQLQVKKCPTCGKKLTI